MGRHERIEDVVPVVGEPVPTEPALAEDLGIAAEVWDKRTFEIARDLATTVVRGFGRVAAAVEAAGGPEVEEDDGIRVKTEAGGWLDEVAPQAAYVPLQRASWLRRAITPVVEDPDGIKFGWVIAQLERTDSPRPKADDQEDGKDAKRAADRAEWDELESDEELEAKSRVEMDDEEEIEDPDLDVVVDRVLLVAGVRHALRLVTGTRRALDGHEGPLMRIPVLKPVVDDEGKKRLPPEEDREVIDAYAARNGFATDIDNRQIITPEAVAAGELKAEDPVALGWAVRDGLADLSQRVRELVKQARARELTPRAQAEVQPDEELAE